MNSDPLGFGHFNSQALHSPTGPAVKAQPKGPGGVKGFLINSLPAIGGGLGAVAGIPGDLFSAGASSVAGGAAGAGVGETLKQRLLGQSVSPKQVAIQAAEGGVASGLGSAVKGGATVAKNLSTLGLKTGSEATPEAVSTVEQAAKPSVGQKLSSAVLNKGNKMESRLGSFAPGQKVGGQQLDTAASQRIQQTVQNEGLNALDAPGKLAQAENKINDLGKAHSTLTETNNLPLTDPDKIGITNELNDRLTNPNNPKYQAGGSSSTVQKYAQTYAGEIHKADDLSALGKEKTGLDNNEINYKTTTDAASNARNLAAKTARGVINDFMNDKVPGLKEVNNRMSNLFEAKGALMNAAGSLANKTTGSEGITGRILSSETADQGKALMAKGLQKAGKALGGETEQIGVSSPAVAETANLSKTVPEAVSTAKSPSSILGSLAGTAKNAATLPVRAVATAIAAPGKSAKAITGQLLARGAGNLIANPPKNTVQPTDASLADLTSSTDDTGTDTSQSPYPEENMLYDVERDPKNATTYEALYKLMNPTGTANAQNAVLSAENTQSQLNAYKSALSTAGGSKGGILGTITKLAGESKLVNTPQAGSAATVNQARNDLGAQLAKLVTGGSRPPEAVTQHYTDLVPTTTDTPQAAAAKFTYIESLVNDMKSNAQSSGNSNSSVDLSGLEAALGQ